MWTGGGPKRDDIDDTAISRGLHGLVKEKPKLPCAVAPMGTTQDSRERVVGIMTTVSMDDDPSEGRPVVRASQ
ncbi:hypothetical protein CSOJ01_02165 [Colletotrichum sojae]|uniref:Uncharacterized protein n=1 Tax=Colletotrichum sojae TaxID=2175907 RepID=A0A8H6N3C3_9PEZI|nr:hypothetical protein CSOJ01_02165 [Colletotrichum sojae]